MVGKVVVGAAAIVQATRLTCGATAVRRTVGRTDVQRALDLRRAPLKLLVVHVSLAEAVVVGRADDEEVERRAGVSC